MASASTTPEKPAESVARLPSPDERPGSDVVIYDGHCRICTRQVGKLPWWDCRKRLSYLSLHDPRVAQRYPDLAHDMLMQDMYIVDHQGRRHRGAEAFRYMTRRVRRLWWLAPLLHIPFSLPLWQWLYRQLANRRYLFGSTVECADDSCSVHHP